MALLKRFERCVHHHSTTRTGRTANDAKIAKHIPVHRCTTCCEYDRTPKKPEWVFSEYQAILIEHLHHPILEFLSIFGQK
ncbi:unnamed protein product [Cylicocyclus nassatus]|uniref:Uncharacterized protein n=1 Tax=Cylicocyclus nassatus TaxID=53992 RepID=A0AA36HGS1_CYLNA|nr:unnamed protein product [Cylicocyclus nassatus]